MPTEELVVRDPVMEALVAAGDAEVLSVGEMTEGVGPVSDRVRRGTMKTAPPKT
jgi:hypothetical protein